MILPIKFRPSILLAIAALGIVAYMGVSSGHIEVSTGCIGGITALGMKLLEAE